MLYFAIFLFTLVLSEDGVEANDCQKPQKQKVALITGITGQDGSYLAEFLLEKGYKVYGLVRRTSLPSTYYIRIAHIQHLLTLVPGDLLDQSSLASAIQEIDPDEVYNLAAQSFVQTSFSQPTTTGEYTALGVTRLLEALRQSKSKAKLYQASSSEMFGLVQEVPQREETPFHPRSPYGVAKVYAHWININYRESYNMFLCNGILFNHESPRRGMEFVTRKISYAVARIKHGLQDKLYLGNLEASRDWGYAKDYVEAMWMMLQQDEPKDYVIATNETHTVREFCELAFGRVGLNYTDYVEIDPQFYRPAEVDLLIGNPALAQKELGWKPKKSFKELVELMVDHDMSLVEQEMMISKERIPD